MDQFSDHDLIVMTREKISGDKQKMTSLAKQIGDFLSGFTSEHVGEPRLLIYIFDNPLLHVDIKFVTLEEFGSGIETPAILLNKDQQLQNVRDRSSYKFQYPNYQSIEDRFWTWIHYALLKIGRGEYFESFDFFGSLRMIVLGPLLHIKHKSLPRGFRQLENKLSRNDLNALMKTLPLTTGRNFFAAPATRLKSTAN